MEAKVMALLNAENYDYTMQYWSSSGFHSESDEDSVYSHTEYGIDMFPTYARIREMDSGNITLWVDFHGKTAIALHDLTVEALKDHLRNMEYWRRLNNS